MGTGYAPADLAAVVLAAGSGTRLRPLTLVRPKALCPVGGVALVDHQVPLVSSVAGQTAVNVHAERDQMLDHLERRGDVHVSVEEPEALGTAGALGALRGWIAGRAALTMNVDAWCRPDLEGFVTGWDGERVRLLLAGDESLHPRALVVASLLPWDEIGALQPEPSGLYERVWRPAQLEGRLDVVRHDGPFVDCGTARDYLRANALAVRLGGDGSIVGSGATTTGRVEASVVGEGARVDGELIGSVVWDRCVVRPAERLVDAVRFDGGRTLLVR